MTFYIKLHMEKFTSIYFQLIIHYYNINAITDQSSGLEGEDTITHSGG